MVSLVNIRCVVFDFGFTLCSDLYFNVSPPGCPEWQALFRKHIFSYHLLLDQWMRGDLATTDIARKMAEHVHLDLPMIIRFMEQGCENLRLNQAVLNYALAQKVEGRKTALVTLNMDIFDRIVAPVHHLDRVFDVIINSANYHELRKDYLWQLAFQRLGSGIRYGNSLLIDDSATNVSRFQKLGGMGYQYSDDASFVRWLGE